MSLALATKGVICGGSFVTASGIIAVCPPELVISEEGSLHLTGIILEEEVVVIPGMATNYLPEVISDDEYRPENINVEKPLPVLKTLPLPGNL